MLKRTIKRWFDDWRNEPVRVDRDGRSGPDWLYNHGPMMQVYAIENGFVARWYTPLGDTTTITYCKDAKEIAETIIAQSAKTKLGIPTHPIGSTQAKVSLSGGGSYVNKQSQFPF